MDNRGKRMVVGVGGVSLRLLQFSRCREVEEYRICFEEKANRTWFGQMGNKREIKNTVDL